jgi:DNA-directed RNA polymerase specialized sigma24 family protein
MPRRSPHGTAPANITRFNDRPCQTQLATFLSFGLPMNVVHFMWLRKSHRDEQDGETYSMLSRVVNKVSTDACLRKDLVQEALIQLWRLKREHPGQHPSWYLQSCQFHVQNILRKGRSIDSWKRRHNRLRVRAADIDEPGEQNELAEPLSQLDSAEVIFSEVCAHDIMALLSKWLEPLDRVILEQLADGLSVREIGAKLKLSHTTVVNRRRRIASCALKLGCSPTATGRETV